MSVLKSRRTESKAEYINTAYLLYTHTINFLSRLSARYSRLLAPNAARLAAEVLDSVEKANSFYPSSESRRRPKAEHLLNARAALMALDVHLSCCYEVMMLNPSGCFVTSTGASVKSDTARKKLETMAQTVGDLIDKEKNFLDKLIKGAESSAN